MNTDPIDVSSDATVSGVLRALAKKSKGKRIGSAALPLHELLNEIPEAEKLKGWGRGWGGHTRQNQRYAWDKLESLAGNDYVRIGENEYVTIRKDSGRFITITLRDKNMKNADLRDKKFGQKSVAGEPEAHALIGMAKACLNGQTLSFCSYIYGDREKRVALWDIINDTPAKATLESWGRGSKYKFDSGCKTHTHLKLQRLCSFKAIMVSKEPNVYVQVNEVPADDAHDYDSLKTTFEVFPCTKGGKLITSKAGFLPPRNEYDPTDAADSSIVGTPAIIAPRNTYNAAKKGHVYALINESMPGLYKVGRTISDPEKRARELSSGTGMPTPFVVHSYAVCGDYVRAEKSAHEMLSDTRIGAKEFFRTEEVRVLNCLNSLGKLTCTGSVDAEVFKQSALTPENPHKKDVFNFVMWAKDHYKLKSRDIKMSPKWDHCQILVGVYGGRPEWATVPFGKLDLMQRTAQTYITTRNAVMQEHGKI